MKYLIKFILFMLVVGGFAACDKIDTNQSYTTGIAPVLKASSAAISAAPADSDKVLLTLSWSNTKQATDSANLKYVIEIDSAGKNFTAPFTKTVLGAMNVTYTAKELNNVLLNRGYPFNVPVDMDIRVTASYANNNDRLVSNVVRVKMTPYKVPPKVALPASGTLFLVGNASDGGWNNPVPVPSQQFARLDETTWGGVFNLTGGNEYLILPVNGSWDIKYGVADKTVAGLSSGGDFLLQGSDNFPAPATSGTYKIIVDFQAGKFTVTPYTMPLPSNLFIVGDATPGGWGNPVPAPAQQLTRLNAAVFQITLPLVGGKHYDFLPVNGSWSHKYSVADNSVAGLAAGGAFGFDLSNDIPGPANSGTYTITVNFITNTFSVQ